jgi:hypothetical protein
VLCLLALPTLLIMGLLVWLLRGNPAQLVLFLPGIVALPVFAIVPSVIGHGVPLSLPTDAAKSAGRGLNMMLVMLAAFGLAGLTTLSWSQGWFWWLVSIETIVAIGLYVAMHLGLAGRRWPSTD